MLLRLPRRPRFLHHWWAILAGYFWLPCPLCSQPFGGQEQHGGSIADSSYPNDPTRGRVVCILCADRPEVAAHDARVWAYVRHRVERARIRREGKQR